MQEAAFVLVDPHPGIEQLAVVAAAGGGHDQQSLRAGKMIVVATPRRALAQSAAWIGSSGT